MKLYIDDERPCPTGWVLVGDYDTAFYILTSFRNMITHVSFDHDLGEKKTGYDLICLLETMQEEGDTIPEHLACHSRNPVGRKRIEQVIAVINRRREIVVESDGVGGSNG